MRGGPGAGVRRRGFSDDREEFTQPAVLHCAVMRFEFQRLLARGPGGVAARVIIDVGALVRRRDEVDPAYEFWPEAFRMRSRTTRSVAWYLGPSSDGEHVDLNAAALVLRGAPSAAVYLSSVPLAGELRASCTSRRAVTVVSAGVGERPWELSIVDTFVESVLDVETGILWDRGAVERHLGAPGALPLLHAVTDGFGGRPPLGTRTARRHRAAILTAILTNKLDSHEGLLPSLREAVKRNRTAIDRRADLLKGLRAETSSAPSIASWLTRAVASATVYIVAEAVREADAFRLRSLTVWILGEKRHALGDAACAALLRETVATSASRWFVPRALDLLAAMVDLGIPLPAVVVDPQHVVHAVDAGNPRGIDAVVPHLCLGTSFSRWCSDLDRKTTAPEQPEMYADILEELDDELQIMANTHRVAGLVAEVAATLPVLARCERWGAWVGSPRGYASWADVSRDVERQLVSQEAGARELSAAGYDIYKSGTDVIVDALLRSGRGPRNTHCPPRLSAQQVLERLVEQGDPVASSVSEARALTAKTGARYWLNILTRTPAPQRLRGMSVPQASGRWGLRASPMQNVPKHNALGQTLRSGLVAPPGYVLVSADQSGYEVRLLADLSNDLNLLGMTRATDVHAAIGHSLFGSTRPPADARRLAKTGLFAVVYGQSKEGFVRSRADLSTTEAEDLYDCVESAFPDVFDYRKSILSDFQRDGQLVTRGGRIIRPVKKTRPQTQRAAFNGIIQGLAADIQRWVLRELDVTLRAFGAHIVHQAHDEIFVAVPLDGDVFAAKGLLVATMTDGVMRRSGLIHNGVTLYANDRQGATWLDLI